MKSWVIKKPGGEEWGCIRKLIIDADTRKLSHADVALTQNNEVIRLSWTELEVTQDGIFLKTKDTPPLSTESHPSPFSTDDIVDIPTTLPGNIGHTRSSHSSPTSL